MTITTETDSRLTARMSVGIGMTHVAHCTGVRMPVSVYIMHIHRRMGSGVVTFDAVGVAVACDADRIAALDVMTCRTALDVPPGVDGMPSPSATDSMRNKVAAEVPYRLYQRAVSLRVMTGYAERPLIVTRIAGALAASGKNSMSITEIRRMHFLLRQVFTTRDGGK